jgi:hypothetical protein
MDERLNEMGWMDVRLNENGTNGYEIKWNGARACHIVALLFTLKSKLRQKKNYGNSNISPHKKVIFKKIPLKETKIVQDIITL